MKIGDLARTAGVTPKAVRYYESLGLLTPTRRENGYREYAEPDVRAVREIRRLIELGIPAARTRPFLDCLAEQGQIDCPSSLAEYRNAINDLNGRIRDLTHRRDALARRLKLAACSPAEVTEATPMDDYYTLPINLPIPQDDGAADHLPGITVPELTLPSTEGSAVELGPGRTVLYIYPLTGHPEEDIPDGWESIPGARGCTAEACDFRDHHEDLVAAGAGRVFGLSSQDTDYQRELVARLRLPFAMLSDPGFLLAQALKLPTFEFRGRRLYKRITLVIRDRAVEHVFYPVHPPNRHAAEVLAWLRKNP